MQTVTNNFRAQLESYNGPLDLLLYLIKKDEIDVLDIPLARVIDQYRIYLELLKEIDPNVCGDYIVMAAQLIEIKSKLLLPRPEEEDGDDEMEDPRLELVQQLLDFKKYKERSLLLEDRYEEFRRRYRRPYVEIEFQEDLDDPIALGDVSIWDLLTAFQRVQLAVGRRGPHRVFLRERPISEYIETIESALVDAPRRTMAFARLFDNYEHRADAIGLFLAILELAKGYRVAIEQEQSFGDLFVRLRSDEETAKLVELERENLDEDPAEAHLLQGEGEEARSQPITPAADQPVEETSETIGEAKVSPGRTVLGSGSTETNDEVGRPASERADPEPPESD